MRVLLIKTSSMGDVIHALPALTDAMRALPGIRFDWVVEEAFQEIPAWHPAVDRVIPVALRRWRKHPLKAIFSGEWKRFKQALREEHYDLILDSQGLLKSAWLASKAKGLHVGFDKASAREPLASQFYKQVVTVGREKHAIIRQREFFAQALAYPVPSCPPDSGFSQKWHPDEQQPYIVLLHGTSWSSKEWPEENWVELAKLAAGSGYRVKLAWGSAEEKHRAERIAKASGGTVLGCLDLGGMLRELSAASRVIGVDSGLAHLAAALAVPAMTLYGASDSEKTGAIGIRQKNLIGSAACAPCLQRSCRHLDEAGHPQCWKNVDPQRVWIELEKIEYDNQ